MEKTKKENRDFGLGIKNAFLFGFSVLALVYILANLYSQRTRTTLIILFLFVALELLPIVKRKKIKTLTNQFLIGFFGGMFFLAIVFWLLVFYS